MVKKLLIVDDEEDYRDLLEFALKKGGYEVASAGNGEDALRLFEEFSPDLVLLDVLLPDMEGFEVCRKIRREGSRKDVPILFCTVRSGMDRVAEGLRAGGDDYILKPFEIPDLLSRVRRMTR